jgi:hypothetical protein
MKKHIYLLIGLFLFLLSVNPVWAQDANISVSPGEVDIGLSFKGADLAVSGKVPSGSDVYIKVASPNDSVLQLSKKGKVSIFWMNVENTNVTNVPKLYQVMTSNPLSQMPLDLQKQLGLDQGFSQIYSVGKVTKHTETGSEALSEEESENYIKSLIDIYKKSSLYLVKENVINVEGQNFNTTVKLPPNIPQEECKITVYAVKNGKLITSSSIPFKVSSVGLVKWLNMEAIYNGPMYGYMAVLIALACGIAIALIFNYIDSILSGGAKTGFDPGASH